MSRQEWEFAREQYRADAPFYGLMMAAMLRADTHNLAKLKLAFPDTFAEVQARYDAPGGDLPHDPQPPQAA